MVDFLRKHLAEVRTLRDEVNGSAVGCGAFIAALQGPRRRGQPRASRAAWGDMEKRWAKLKADDRPCALPETFETKLGSGGGGGDHNNTPQKLDVKVMRLRLTGNLIRCCMPKTKAEIPAGRRRSR